MIVSPWTPFWVRCAAALIRRLPAGRYRVMKRLGKGSFPFVAALPAALGGLRFTCDLHDGIAREVCFTGQYEPQETALLQAFLRPGMVFADVGANWGYFTLLAAAKVGRLGRVISLEPDPRLFATLQSNVILNGLNQVELLQVAAAAETAILTLAGYDERCDNWGLSKLIERGAPSPYLPQRSGEVKAGASTFGVVARPLDVLLDEQGIDQVDFLKMDIEGAEELALRGMGAGLVRHRYRRILLVVHPTILTDRGCSVSEVLRSLVQAGYRGWWIDHSWSVSRKAAYRRTFQPREFLQPFRATQPPDAWPHMLWLCPEVELE